MRNGPITLSMCPTHRKRNQVFNFIGNNFLYVAITLEAALGSACLLKLAEFVCCSLVTCCCFITRLNV